MHKAMDGNRRGLWLAYGLWLYFWLVLLTLIIGTLIIIFTCFNPRGAWGGSAPALGRAAAQSFSHSHQHGGY
jgi:hypothetical protein